MTAGNGRSPKRVALFGNFGTGNFGNDGSFEAFLELLKRAPFPVEAECICWGDSEIARRFGVTCLPISAEPPERAARLNRLLMRIPNRLANVWRAYAVARRYDLIVVPGTGILDDFQERWSAMPYQLLLWTAAARLAGVPFGFFAIGAGPIVGASSRRLMIGAAKLAAYRSYRDDISKTFLTGHGVDVSADAIMPDVAFALAPPVSATAERSKPVVGVGVMAYDGWRANQDNGASVSAAYEAKIAAFALWALDQGFAVRVLIGDEHDRPTAEKLVQALRERASAPGDVLADEAATLSDIMAQMAGTDLVVATRYHNIVCALIAAKPVISIGYAAKNDELLKSAGLGAFTHGIETLDVEALKQQFLGLYDTRSEYARGIVEARDAFRARIDGEFVALMQKALGADTLELRAS